MRKSKVILDVPLEDLKDILSDKGWDVSTVTEKLGPTKEDRDDENILKYSKETNSVVVTVDKPFVSRLRSAGVKVVALALEDKAKIINEQLEKLFPTYAQNSDLENDEILDDFNRIKSGEASRMAEKNSS